MALDAVTVHEAVASQTSPCFWTSKVWISISITGVPSSETQRHPGNDCWIESRIAATTFSLASVLARRSTTFRFHVFNPPGHCTSTSGKAAGRTVAAAEQPKISGHRSRHRAAARDMAGLRTAGRALLVPRRARRFGCARSFRVEASHGLDFGPQVRDKLRRRQGFSLLSVGQDEPAGFAERFRRQLEDRFAAGAGLDLLFRVPDHFPHFPRGLRREADTQTEGRAFASDEDAERVAEKRVGVEVARNRVALARRLGAFDACEVEVLDLALILGQHHPVAAGEHEGIRLENARLARLLPGMSIPDRERDALLERLRDRLPGFFAHGAKGGGPERELLANDFGGDAHARRHQLRQPLVARGEALRDGCAAEQRHDLRRYADGE